MRYIKPTSRDVEDISTLFRESFKHPLLSKRFSDHLVSIYLSRPEFALMAKDGSKTIGFIYATDDMSKLAKSTNLLDKLLPWRTGYFLPAKMRHIREPFLLLCCVDAKYRNKGIASALLKNILGKMRRRVSAVFCQIYLSNAPSIRFTEKQGAKLVEKRGFLKKYGIYKIDLRLLKNR